MAWGTLLKTAAKGLTKKAVAGAGKKMAGKMLGRGKKKQPQQQQPPSDGGGEDTGGSLVKAGSSAIVPMGVKSSALAISETSAGGGGGQDLEGTVLRIKTSVIKVENLLAGSAALQEKQRQDARKAKEAADAAAQEGELEKPKDKKQKFSIPKPKIVMSFWKKMKNFFLNTLLGFITVRLLPFVDKLKPIIMTMVRVGEWILNFVGMALNILVTAIDWAYKLVGKARNWVGDTFGEQALVWFDKLSGGLKTLINGFIVWKLIGEKIFQAAVGAIKGAWNLARNIVKGVINIGKNIGRGLNRIRHPKKTAEAIKRLNNVKKIKKAKELAKLQKVQKIKNIGKLRKVAKLKSVAGKGIKLAAKGAGKVGGLAAKIFGKSAGAISGAFKGAQPFISKFFGRVPIVGPLVVGIVSILSGDPVGQALFKTMGAALGGFLGTFIPIPILGTLIGETLGVFVGDLLYTLLFGGGMKAVGQKLKDTLSGIFKAGTAVKDWIVGGFGRFFTGFMEEHSFGIPGWIVGGIKTATLGKVDLKDGRIPNLLQLYNPFAMGPLLVKSFFPPGKKKKKGSSDLKMGDKSTAASDDTIDAVSQEAYYETNKAGRVEFLPLDSGGGGTAENVTDKTVSLVNMNFDSSSLRGSDPYARLYRGDV